MKNNFFGRQFLTVFGYEFYNITRKKVFAVTTILFAVLFLAAGLLIPVFFPMKSDTGNGTTNPDQSKNKGIIEVYGKDELYSPELFSTQFAGYTVEFKTGSVNDATTSRINDGEIKAAIAIKNGQYDYYGIDSMTVTLKYEAQQYINEYTKQAAMSKAGLSAEQIVAINTPAKYEIHSVSGKDSEQTYAMTYVMVMLLYISIMLYGQLVAMSVATEKSSRAMELLITSAKPNSLIFGKLAGVGLAGVCQFGVWVISAAAGLLIRFDYWNQISFISGVFKAPLYLYLLMFLFYILGYLMFSSMFGALGSLVSRVEDIQTTMTPIVLVFVAGLMIAMYGMVDPSNMLIKISSFIPFFAPMCMFVRISMDTVPIYQIIISIILTTACTGLFGWLGAKIYRVGVLMYGKPPSLPTLIKVLRSNKNY